MTSTEKAIPYGRQTVTDADIESVISVLKSDIWTQGPLIEEFEKKFAAYTGSRYAVAVANGTAALHLCTLALNVKEGTNVITTPITFAASANCVRYCGGTVHFADIDPATVLIDIDKVEELIKSKPQDYFSGIIPVDFAGAAVNLEKLRGLADKYNLWIIEDACHAPGGYFTDSNGNKQLCGNGKFAELAIFSFHPVKHIASGEGGMITTNDEKLYKTLLQLRTHGITKDPSLMQQHHGGWYYEMQVLGYNYRIPDILCALGISQLERADEGLERRREIAARYRKAFEGKIEMPDQPEGHAYHLFLVRVADRKGLYDHLRTKNIFCQVHYIPVHTLPYYQGLGYDKISMPHAEKYYSECLSIPMYPALSNEEQDFVIDSILNYK